MKFWIGKALVFIGGIHIAYGIYHFHSELLAFMRSGFWNAAVKETDGPLAFWFIAIGFLAVLLGFFTDWVEKKIGTLPPFLGRTLLIYSVVGVIHLPISGIWLILLTSVFAILKSRSKK